MVTSAFKAEAEIQAIPMHWLPQNFRGLAHFIAAGNIAPLWRYFMNSMIFALTHVAATVFFGKTARDLVEGGDKLTDEIAETLREWAGHARERGVAAIFEAAMSAIGCH